MFSSLKIRIILGVYIFVIISIPLGAYLASEQTTFKSKAKESSSTKKVVTSPKPTISPAKLGIELDSSSDSTNPTLATSFGPTLSLKVNFEGRPKDNESGSLFVGILEGTISLNPKFILSFTIDVPKSGEYTGLSLAGLSPGTTYSALLKGSGQIASAKSFVMSPTVTNLNSLQAVTLLSGDLNEDNTINTSDYSIAQKLSGSTPSSLNWNGGADFNKDGIINSFDLALLTKNFGKIGDSGAWTSPLPKTATPSGGLTDPSTSQGGYWIWIPPLPR